VPGKRTPAQLNWRLAGILVCAVVFAASFLDSQGSPADWRLSTWLVASLCLCLFAVYAIVVRRSNHE
jgi:hypothetical protein